MGNGILLLIAGVSTIYEGVHIDKKPLHRLLTWLDGQPSEYCFVSGLQKLEQRVKKFIELRRGYVE
jgi:hypothetical protein